MIEQRNISFPESNWNYGASGLDSQLFVRKDTTGM